MKDTRIGGASCYTAIAKEAVGAIQNESPTFGVGGLETTKIVSCKYTQHALSEGLQPVSKDST